MKAGIKALWDKFDKKNAPPKDWEEVTHQFDFEGDRYKVKALVKDGTDSPLAANINISKIKIKKT